MGTARMIDSWRLARFTGHRLAMCWDDDNNNILQLQFAQYYKIAIGFLFSIRIIIFQKTPFYIEIHFYFAIANAIEHQDTLRQPWRRGAEKKKESRKRSRV